MDSIPLISCLQPLVEIAMSDVHTHTLQFLFGLFLSTDLRLHINTSGCVYSVKELKESEEFQKYILRWCSVTYVFFVLLVKKIIWDKEYFFQIDEYVRKGEKKVKFI